MNVRSTLLSFTALAALCWSGEANAQLNCGTDEMHRKLLLENPALAEQEALAERDLQALLQAMKNNRDGEDTITYYIPVVFHIMHNPNYNSSANTADDHNVTDAQCLTAINILNRDFRKLNADTIQLFNNWGDLASDIRIQFRLATKDPFGNCTNGIDRITTLRSNAAGDFTKLQPWQRNRYLNVWVVQSIGSGAAGYSNYPSSVSDNIGALRDGVEILHDYFGNIGTSNEGSSRALTHEVGHWLNLAHVWGDNNGEDNAPTGYMSATCGNDGVEDTPVTKGHEDCLPIRRNDISCANYPLRSTVYTFDDVNTGSGTTDPSPVPIAIDTTYADSANGVIMSPFTAHGVASQPSTDDMFSFSGWGTGATDGDNVFANLTGSLNTSKYYSFTITPQPRYAFILDSLSFKVGRSATGPRTYAVRISNFTANTGGVVYPSNPNLQTVPGTGVTFFFVNDDEQTQSGTFALLNPAPTALNTPLEVRIYAWNAEDADGTFSVDDVRMHGKFGITDNIQNYMEYSYCNGHMFTFGQRDRMRAAALNSMSGRSNLWTNENHIFTGIMGYEYTCGPTTDFYAVQRFVCMNTPVQMRDNSENFPTSWAWEFPGGTPSTSTERNPIVQFNQPGAQTVTLTTSNADGSQTRTLHNVVYVSPEYSDVAPYLNEPFNGAPERWISNNMESNQTTWAQTNVTGRNGNGCMRLNSSMTYGTVTQDIFNSPGASFVDRDELVSPTLDLRYTSNIQLSFWYAYAASTPTVANITEKLSVFWSTTCGRNWSQVANNANFNLTGAALVTAGVAGNEYLPQAGDWRQITLTLPSIAASQDVRIRFVFTTSMYANDIFIDDVTVTGNTVGVDELGQSGLLSLMPNPATDEVTVELGLAGAQKGMLSFLDMTGREVFAQGVTANDQRLTFDLKSMGLSSGVYLVRLTHANGQRSERLLVK